MVCVFFTVCQKHNWQLKLVQCESFCAVTKLFICRSIWSRFIEVTAYSKNNHSVTKHEKMHSSNSYRSNNFSKRFKFTFRFPILHIKTKGINLLINLLLIVFVTLSSKFNFGSSFNLSQNDYKFISQWKFHRYRFHTPLQRSQIIVQGAVILIASKKISQRRTNRSSNHKIHTRGLARLVSSVP